MISAGFELDFIEFQCRTRLCVWCSVVLIVSYLTAKGFNAARGFVCGAASQSSALSHLPLGFNAARGFVCGAANDVYEQVKEFDKFQCRTRLCVWCSKLADPRWLTSSMFQCRTRLCVWCSFERDHPRPLGRRVSMPHAALCVVQHWRVRVSCDPAAVSMPHAALCVVQLVSTNGEAVSV